MKFQRQAESNTELALILLIVILGMNAIGSFFYVIPGTKFYTYWVLGSMILFLAFYIPYLIGINSKKFALSKNGGKG